MRTISAGIWKPDTEAEQKNSRSKKFNHAAKLLNFRGFVSRLIIAEAKADVR